MNNITRTCGICHAVWAKEDLDHCRWMGVPFIAPTGHNIILCPECYNYLKAAFIGNPDAFKQVVKGFRT